MRSLQFLFILFVLNCGLVPVSYAGAEDQELVQGGVVLASLGKDEPTEEAQIPRCVEPLAIDRIRGQIQAFSEHRALGCSLVEDSIVFESLRLQKFAGKEYRFYRYVGKMKCNYWSTEEVGKIVQFDGENCH